MKTKAIILLTGWLLTPMAMASAEEGQFNWIKKIAKEPASNELSRPINLPANPNEVIREVVNSSVLSASNPIYAKGYIYKVVDGDTLVVNFREREFQKFQKYNNEKTRNNINDKYQSIKIRIANINTPESVHRDKNKNTKAGKAAAKFLYTWVNKKNANVRCFDIGYYGRFICNVIVDGRFDVGYEQIAKGNSKYITKWGYNPYFHEEYQQAELKSNTRTQ